MKKIISILFLTILFSSFALAAALTGSIGNAKMILRAETGDTIERTILVQNVNDVAVNIEMYASGDLENYTKIEEANFTLEPGENRDVQFTIKVKKSGTTETKINVKFATVTGSGGVGLSSTIIIMAKDTPWEETNETEKIIDDSVVQTDDSQNFLSTFISENPALSFLIAAMVILFILIIILLILIKRKTKQKRAVNKVE